MTWDPESYPRTIRDEVHDYERLQEEVVTATGGGTRKAILELGVGAGETAARLLEAHPGAQLVGIDSSAEMLSGAASSLPPDRVTLVEQDLASTLPEGPFDLIVSALAIHHLKGDAKAGLFRDVHARLAPGGVFVMGDVIVPHDRDDAVIEIEPGYDFPDPLDIQMRWLAEAGFVAAITWLQRDLAVVRAEPAGS